MNITIPTITSLPTDLASAAAFIWDHQNKLNAISHPEGRGTTDVGTSKSEALKQSVAFDYHLALASEVTELFEGCFFKHWSSEAKAGRRFELINAEASSGEGSAQNVYVEITDIGFFTVSLLQVLGMTEAEWTSVWLEKNRWEGAYGNPKVPADMKRIIQASLDLLTLAGTKPTQSVESRADIARQFITLVTDAGLTWEVFVSLYAQKLIKNYERQVRGRKQVGDTLSEGENAAVKI